MDDYPEQLTPPKDFRGNVDQDKFHEWWSWAKAYFPNVPENAAHYWLYENWGVSPYDYLKSANYQFEAVAWPSSRLFELRSEWGEFDPTLGENIRAGDRICHNNEPGEVHRLAKYVMEKKKFPQPIIILDNRDGNLQKEYEYADRVPAGIILICTSKHRRLSALGREIRTNL